ncbi:MAG: T9SS type A sorting domain-containing protein [Candidatus Aegiribacteria sp.]|nr:T9SS type A sorting domain-containing protein [Candidatus Aegiribacteria sp.]
MCRTILTLVFFSFLTVTFADSAIQTDWSDGPGLPGPVIEWGAQFYIDACIEWENSPGDITLQYLAEEHIINDTFEDAWSVYSEDIDGDGDMDVLGAAKVDDEITWWENLNGSGTSWAEYTIDGNFDGAISVYSADINGDGDMDVLGAASIANDITWWENSDTGSDIYWVEHTIDADYNWPREVYSEDIDGDGDMDVLGCGSDFENHITWWENINGSGLSWNEHTVYQGGYEGACAVYSEDIDGDGDMDILGAEIWDMYAGYIRWFENEDGSGTSWSIHTVYSEAALGEWSVYSEDIDGDGDMDVLASIKIYSLTDDIAWWENTDGAGTSWTEHIIDSDFNAAHRAYSDDVDGDGDMDVLGASYYDGISWWENIDGSGTSWNKYEVDTDFEQARSVYSEDIDGDGNKDILGASSLKDAIVWWDNTGYSPDGSLESSILDTESDTDWDYLEWNSQTPSGTSVSFQVRASDDHTSMGEWSDTLSIHCSLDGILTDGDRYLQYRTILETSNAGLTPSLNDVTISWDLFGIEETAEPVPSETELYPIAPNPSSGSPIIRFGLLEPASVEISIYDMSGRVIRLIREDEYSTGFHDVFLEEFSPGIYFCRMISGDFTATQQFVVID